MYCYANAVGKSRPLFGNFHDSRCNSACRSSTLVWSCRGLAGVFAAEGPRCLSRWSFLSFSSVGGPSFLPVHPPPAHCTCRSVGPQREESWGRKQNPSDSRSILSRILCTFPPVHLRLGDAASKKSICRFLHQKKRAHPCGCIAPRNDGQSRELPADGGYATILQDTHLLHR